MMTNKIPAARCDRGPEPATVPPWAALNWSGSIAVGSEMDSDEPVILEAPPSDDVERDWKNAVAAVNRVSNWHERCDELDAAVAEVERLKQRVSRLRMSSGSHDCGGGPESCGGCCICMEQQSRGAFDGLAAERDAPQAQADAMLEVVEATEDLLSKLSLEGLAKQRCGTHRALVAYKAARDAIDAYRATILKPK